MKHAKAPEQGVSSSMSAALRMAWELLDPRERVQAFLVLAMMLIAALFSAAMVLSVMPFLQVLSQPEIIETTPALAWLYERFDFASTYDFIIALGVATVLFILIANLVQLVKQYALIRFATMRTHSLAVRLLSAYLRQPYEFFLNRHSGEMATGVLSESTEVVNGFFKPLGELVTGAMTTIAIITALIWVNPQIALWGLVLIGGSYALIYVSVRLYLSRIGQDRVRANAQRFRFAGEALTGIKDVKIMRREHGYLQRFSAPSLTYARTRVRAAVIEQTPRFLIQTILFGGIVIVCLVIVDRASFEQGSALGGLLPILGAFALGGQKLLPEVQKVFGAFTKLRFSAAAVQRLHRDILEARDRARLSRHMPAPLGMTNSLTFRNVTYRYPGTDRAGISDLSLEIRKGERIGIVGSTGAGKSTFADLVLGLLQPQSGEIRADDTSIDTATVRAWQASIGYVPQEIFVIDSSIAENIAFGVPPREIDRDQVVASARLAQIDSFIREDLPQGYDTFVGERGVRLSGGQRQRLGIARALYHNADVIVFDEATSALDTLTEREVMAAIEALPGEKTILMIAHRLSTVRRCDRILVLEKGQVAGFGPWDTLIETCPAFRRLVDVAQAA